MTDATGFVGRALIPRLQRDGHAVVAWVRSPARARGLLGADVELVHADTAPDGLVGAIERSDAVVNLAGEAADGRQQSEWRGLPGVGAVIGTEPYSLTVGLDLGETIGASGKIGENRLDRSRPERHQHPHDHSQGQASGLRPPPD